jgi:DNA (cytosine-5)-methyltransferase 1
MRYLSVCSGIEAATAAWEPLGWSAAAFAEIEKFPSAVLAHHYPNVPNLGDFTKIEAADVGAVDLLVGGTPCQSFSVAGLRGGLADDRGNLALEFLRLADRARPKWLVWENVPGVLSSNGGRDFGSILGGMVELGYGFAYRVADAQFFGVPQRRRRVFVVGYLGDWRRAAAVLFERHSLQGHSAPSRQKGEGTAPTIASRPSGGGGLGTDFDCDGGLIAGTLGQRTCDHMSGMKSESDFLVSQTLLGKENDSQDTTRQTYVPVARCVTARQTRLDWETENFVTHSLRADGFDASEDGTGRGTPLITVGTLTGNGDAHSGFKDELGLVAVAFAENSRAELRLEGGNGQTVASLKVGGGKPGQGYPAIAFGITDDETCAEGVMPTLGSAPSGHGPAVASSAVRRLTPRECERLQGFPDDYTLVRYRGKSAADGPRYKALGNSMAVPVMRWIGERIELIGRAILEAAA